jgi:DNA-binding phage protein
MNRIPTPTKASLAACDAWRLTVLKAMREQNRSMAWLARASGVERKTIYDWLDGKRVPKLDSAARIFYALGFDELKLSLTDYEEESDGENQ